MPAWLWKREKHSPLSQPERETLTVSAEERAGRQATVNPTSWTNIFDLRKVIRRPLWGENLLFFFRPPFNDAMMMESPVHLYEISFKLNGVMILSPARLLMTINTRVMASLPSNKLPVSPRNLRKPINLPSNYIRCCSEECTATLPPSIQLKTATKPWATTRW